MTTPRAGFLTISAAARLFSVHPRTIRRYIASGDIRQFVRLGRVIRIPAAELDRFAAVRTVETTTGAA